VGVDYRAMTVIGVPFDWDHFFEDYTEDRVVCSHPETDGVRFCPICGARDDERVVKTKKTRVRKPFLKMAPFDGFSDPRDLDADELDDFQHDTYRLKIGKVEVCNIGDSESPDLVLGVQIHQTDSSNGGRDLCPSTEWARVKDKSDFACDELERLGFDRKKTQCWTVLSCSY